MDGPIIQHSADKTDELQDATSLCMVQQKIFIHRVHAEWQLVMQMADGAAELQDAVVKLCCLWWQKELPGKADMVPQMIPYLLYQATVSGVH